MFLLALVVGLGGVVAAIPMTALVAVMIFVAYATFDWHSITPTTLRRMPVGETAVMVLTVVPTVLTGNLALGVGIGVLTSMAIFARRVAHLLDVERIVSPDGTSVIYSVTGQLFFAANQELTDAFHHPDDPHHIIIDMSQAHVWDASAVSAVSALDALTHKYALQGKSVEIVGLNQPSSDIHGALSGRVSAAH